jgi:hypothetical protein
VFSVVSGGIGCLLASAWILRNTPALRAYTRHEQPVFMPEDERRIAQAGQAE